VTLDAATAAATTSATLASAAGRRGARAAAARALAMAAALGRMTRPRAFHQDLPHGVGGNREEMCAVVRGQVAAGRQAQPGFMDQPGRVEGLPGTFAPHLASRDAAQLVVDQRQQGRQRIAVAGPRAFEQHRDRRPGGRGHGDTIIAVLRC